MKCDIKFLIGGFDTPIEISKTEPGTKNIELDSIEDIVNYLMSSDETRAKQLISNLNSAEVISTENLNTVLDETGVQIIGNVTISDLTEMYPDVMSKFEDHGEKYIFALRDKVYLNGDELKGRVEHKRKVVYFIRNESDLKLFVNTERKKALVKKYISDESIDLKQLKFKEYLEKKYLSILKKCISKYNSENSTNLNLQQLLIHFLDHKEEFTIGGINYILVENRTIGEILNNFCLELSTNRIYDSSSDSALVKAFKFLNFKMDSFGKKDFYEILILHGLEGVSEEAFVNLSDDEIKNLWNKLQDMDPSLKFYTIESTDITKSSEKLLTKDEFINLINQVNSIRKAENPNFEEFIYNAKTIKYLELEEFLGDYLDSPRNILNKSNLTLKLKKGLFGKPKITYFSKELNNDDKIKLKYKGLSLENLFGHITEKTFIPVNDKTQDVINGVYNGYHIYEHIDTKTNLPIYIISKSIIRPNLYTKGTFGSLDEAKLAIDGIVYNSPIKNTVIRSLNDAWYQGRIPRNIQFDKFIGSGSTIESIKYPLKKDNLSAKNLDLLDLNFEQASEILKLEYKELPIESLNSGEKLALFIYKMNNLGIFPGSIFAHSKENIKKLKLAIDDINKAPIEYHIVERTYSSNIYLKKFDPKSINSNGIVVKPGKTSLEKGKYISTINALYKLKDSLLKTIFKDSSINIEISTNEKLKALKGSNNKPLLNTVKGVKGFVHNNTIYINADSAHTDDLIHETMHFVLGVLRTKSPKIYEEVINYFGKKASSFTWDSVNKKYENLAHIDKTEEVAVRYISNQLYNGTFAYNDDMSEVMNELDKVFSDVQKFIKNVFTDDSKDDISFLNLFNQLFQADDVLDRMKERRITTNIIQSKMNSEIYEKCDKK